MTVTVGVLAMVVGACADQKQPARTDAAVDAATDAALDASVDAPVDAIALGPWGTPQQVFATDEDDPTLTADQLEMYLNKGGDIYATTRESLTDEWAMPAKVIELSSASNETTPELTSDGLTIYVASRRTPTLGQEDIWMATRASRTSTWDPPTRIVELSSCLLDMAATPHADGKTLVLTSSRGGIPAIYVSTRASATDPWGLPVELTELASAIGDLDAVLSADAKTIYWGSASSGGGDLMQATRDSVTDPFGAPEVITELSDPLLLEADPWVSPEGRHMFFERDGGIWESSR